ncbi:hypothetical protein Taro_049898 [Colocasia esculenta]|uniref:CCHC-type domain-containing protein n=1 Tax=Colocasia esculenta TaxID=4460 RepID=A0A843XCB1_COLES|nr:hypothetical protein [Colocasia esculenta]
MEIEEEQESDESESSSDSENEEMAMLTRQFKKFLRFKKKGSDNSKTFPKKDFTNKLECNKKSNMIVCYECKKPGHMRGECLELKKKLKKDKFTFKKAKAMMATWSDEDEEDNAQGSSGDEEIQCLMARSEDSNELSTAGWAPVDSQQSGWFSRPSKSDVGWILWDSSYSNSL